jgi:hypothetical protein
LTKKLIHLAVRFGILVPFPNIGDALQVGFAGFDVFFRQATATVVTGRTSEGKQFAMAVWARTVISTGRDFTT